MMNWQWKLTCLKLPTGNRTWKIDSKQETVALATKIHGWKPTHRGDWSLVVEDGRARSDSYHNFEVTYDMANLFQTYAWGLDPGFYGSQFASGMSFSVFVFHV